MTDILQEAIIECRNSSQNLVKRFLKSQKTIRIKISSFFADSKTLAESWNRQSKGLYRWNNILLVWDEPVDYYIVLTATNDFYVPEKTIVFQMEPYVEEKIYLWGQWCRPNVSKVFKHSESFNNLEWHLSKTYNELSIYSPNKTKNNLSTVLSNKYFDDGHIRRVDFIKFLENKGDVDIDVYGSNHFNYKNYKGILPDKSKDDALFPYKYTFNCENNFIDNYVTEKFVDAILSECLIFYSGCPNIHTIFDSRAFIYLELRDFEKDYNKIKEAINKDVYQDYLPFIKLEKQRILNDLQFFPRLEKYLNTI